MSYADQKFARCVLPNGDEWHLYWTKAGQEYRILIPIEKLREANVDFHSTSGNWYPVDGLQPVGKEVTLLNAGPFPFIEIHFPKAEVDFIKSIDDDLTRQQEIVEWVPPMSVVMGAVAVIHNLFAESSLPHGACEAMDYAGHPDRGNYRGFAGTP